MDSHQLFGLGTESTPFTCPMLLPGMQFLFRNAVIHLVIRIRPTNSLLAIRD